LFPLEPLARRPDLRLAIPDPPHDGIELCDETGAQGDAWRWAPAMTARSIVTPRDHARNMPTSQGGGSEGDLHWADRGGVPKKLQ
jgi:hypothetical protein